MGQSTLGFWGSWYDPIYCPGGENFLKAAQFRSERDIRDGDDTAGNDLNMECEGGEILEGHGGPWGSWSSWVFCPPATAICGIQTDVEPRQGFRGGDDTALNAVKFFCCRIE